VKIAPDAAALYEKGELIVKVKEPIAGDLPSAQGSPAVLLPASGGRAGKLTRACSTSA
jgi:hypothetical protein